MKINGTNRAAPTQRAAQSRSTSAAYKAAAAGAVRKVDSVSFLGIPENELTPKVREAITTLLAEVDTMRSEIDEQRQRISHLEELADRDTLTPVINRRAFVRELTRVVSYGERYDTPSSLLYIDLNGLKQINDSHGHPAGDAALMKLATILTEQVRGSDIVGRLGGDEFGVLLAHADEAVATEKALQLTDIIESNPLHWESHEIPINVSFGAYTFTGGENVGDALAAADRAMYVQKNARKANAET
jgi:diguanylate cyclase (GGDEF)-like protein